MTSKYYICYCNYNKYKICIPCLMSLEWAEQEEEEVVKEVTSVSLYILLTSWK